jgi:hypothetical protein
MIEAERLRKQVENAIEKLHGSVLDVKITSVETKDQKMTVHGILVEYDQLTTRPFTMRLDQNGKLMDFSVDEKHQETET